MSNSQPLSGIIAPLVTPMLPGGAIDMTSVHRQVAFLLDAGVHGLWVNGTTGEFHALDPYERAELIREVVKAAAGRVPVIAQVGDAATRLALRHIDAAAEAGADYVAAVGPYYLEFSQAELVSYYRTLAGASSLPLVIYHIPQMSKAPLAIATVVELARDTNIVAIKDSASDLNWYRLLLHGLKRAGADLRCFVGGGNLVDISLLMGGHGAMCAVANLMPRKCVAIYNAAMQGNWGESSRLQREMTSVSIELSLASRTNYAGTVAIYKWLLREAGIITTDTVAAPVKPINDQEAELLARQVLPLICKMEPGMATKGQR